MSFSSYRIFLDLSLSESQTMISKLHRGRFSQRSDHRDARYSRFCEIIFGKSGTPFEHDLPWRCAIKCCCRTALRCSPSPRANFGSYVSKKRTKRKQHAYICARPPVHLQIKYSYIPSFFCKPTEQSFKQQTPTMHPHLQ